MARGLQSIVSANEHVKQVRVNAHRIERLTLNAILLSKRVGDAAVGFSVISDELRKFSKDLNGCMVELKTAINASVITEAMMLHRQHLQRLLDEACEQIDTGPLTLKSDQAAETHRVRMSVRLSELVDQSLELLRFADVISRSAKIEAAYGGAWREQLTDIAEQLAALIAHIDLDLQRMHRLTH